MIAYADSSFAVALFTQEEDHGNAGWQWWKTAGLCQIMISRLTVLETENTFHALRVDHKLNAVDFRQATTGFAQARMEGLLVRRETPVHRLYPEAHRLIAHYSARAAYGTLDILHVAAAVILRADTFLTFDKSQAKLAASAGMRVEPPLRR
jgi:hypothetical protein